MLFLNESLTAVKLIEQKSRNFPRPGRNRKRYLELKIIQLFTINSPLSYFL